MLRCLPKESAYTGKLPNGCRYCGTGRKLVLFVTGLCTKRCFYCPLSAEKRGRDIVFANEKKVTQVSDIIMEAELIDSAGTGITGGDPLKVLPRTIRYIHLLKKHFGKNHHIHLYTANADASAVSALAGAGLDELRFHPPTSIWNKMRNSSMDDTISAALETSMIIGAEVPAIPGMKRELLSLVSYLDDNGVGFFNLNELEFSETNADALKSRGYRVKNDISSGVAGSEKMALDIIKNADVDIPLHYCSASYKDGVQLRNRITRRAINIARQGDIVTDDGLLVKGVIECRNMKKTMTELLTRYGVRKGLVYIDREKNRLEVAPWVLTRIAPKLPEPCFIVEEYPTADRLEVEKMRIN